HEGPLMGCPPRRPPGPGASTDLRPAADLLPLVAAPLAQPLHARERVGGFRRPAVALGRRDPASLRPTRRRPRARRSGYAPPDPCRPPPRVPAGHAPRRRRGAAPRRARRGRVAGASRTAPLLP